MKFDPTIHTKEFLLSNPDVAFYLAEKSKEFAINDLANDFEILQLVNKNQTSVSHILAEYQPAWIRSEAANSFEILILRNGWGVTVAHNLAEYQPAWVQSEAAKSSEILKLADSEGKTVAHKFALYQSEWIYSEAAKSFEVLILRNGWGDTVAHYLACNQSEWIHSEAAKNLEILKLADNYSITVAHRLAQYQPQWVLSEAANNLEILSENSKFGSVALFMTENNENCINHEILFHKQVLTLVFQGKSLAEEISQRYKSKGFDVPIIAMKLISQGSAYKHSVAIDLDVGEAILNQSKTLIEDSSEPLIALKQLQALYSTFSHNVAKIISTQDQKSLQKWQGLLLQSENMIRQHLDKHPDLYDIEHIIDIHCEPGDDLLKKIKSERVLSSNLESLNEISAELSSDQATKAQNFY